MLALQVAQAQAERKALRPHWDRSGGGLRV